MVQTDKATLSERFKQIFGTTDHPLHEKLQKDLDGSRGLHAVLTDLREAEAHRARESKSDDSHLFIAAL